MVSIDSVARYWYGPLGVSLEERYQGVWQKKICKKTAHRFLSRNSRRSGIFNLTLSYCNFGTKKG